MIGISGGAQAYASAMAITPGASSNMSHIDWLSPGSGGSQLVRGTQSTDRYHAHGIVDGLVNFTASSEAGTVNDKHERLDCDHHWAKCELEQLLKLKCGNAHCPHDPCQSKIFARNVKGPRDNPNKPTPPPDPGYRIGTWCTWDAEGVECHFFIYWDWGWLGGGSERGGPSWWWDHIKI